jgi:hypothetical protein
MAWASLHGLYSLQAQPPPESSGDVRAEGASHEERRTMRVHANPAAIAGGQRFVADDATVVKLRHGRIESGVASYNYATA